MKRKHIGAIGFRFFRLRVCFHKQAVYPYRHTGPGYRLDKTGHSAGYPARLIGLLQRVRYIKHHGETARLHFWNTPVIDNQILITECRTPLGKHDMIITSFDNFVCCKLHGFGRKELSFFYIHYFSCSSRSKQQIGLST